MKTEIGNKFYRYNGIDDTFTILRVLRMQNKDTFGCIDQNGNKLKVTKEDLKDYHKLTPDGIITFSVVKLQDRIKDVIVALYKTKDLDENNIVPFAVCRQSVNDVFSNQIVRQNLNGVITYVGTSMSLETVPEDVPYNIMLACNEVEYSTVINIYLDDKLNDILSLLNKQDKYDTVLSTLKRNNKDENVQGYCSSLIQLLTENNFMYDFLRAFNIYQVPFKTEVIYDHELAVDQRMYLENLLKVEMFESFVIKFDKEVDINKIKRNHVFISDKNGEIYIIAYNKGEYINRAYKDNIKDKRDQLAMLKYKNKK